MCSRLILLGERGCAVKVNGDHDQSHLNLTEGPEKQKSPSFYYGGKALVKELWSQNDSDCSEQYYSRKFGLT